MGDIFLTSDSHFCHNKDFIFSPRGFESVEEMNEIIIERWNSVVKDGDIVYHLGDVMMGTDWAWAIKNFPRLKGEKYLAFGNHCTDNKIKFYKEHAIFKEISMGYRLKSKKLTLILSHYPQLVINHENKQPVWTIHGHTHSKDRFSDIFHAYNVNVDAHNCYPVNLEEMISEIKNAGRNIYEKET